MRTQTVKVRARQGTKSMDLTIPVKIIDEENIKEGDIFTVEKLLIGGKLILSYKLVYKQ